MSDKKTVDDAIAQVVASSKNGYAIAYAVTLADEVLALRDHITEIQSMLEECQKLAVEEIEAGLHRLRAAEISLEVEKARSLTYLQCIQLFTANSSAKPVSVFATKAAA